MQPKVWRFVCFASSVVGLLCYALSPSFNNLLGKWTWWKLLSYIIFSFFICVTLLITTRRQRSTSLRLENHLAFLVLMITSIYSFFFDKAVNGGKADAYSLISYASFAITSLGLPRLTQFGFEIDLLYFFCGGLIIQLMKIHLWLGIIGGSFSYFLGILRSSLDMPEEHIRSQVQDQVIIRIDSDSVEDVNADDHDGTPGNGDDLVWQQLMDCIKALEKENETLVPMVCSHLDKHLSKATVDSEFKDENQIPEPQVDPDVNLVMDELLPSGIITRLRDTVKLMMEAGFEEKCRDAYSNWRREFLEQCLSALGLQLQALDIENWIKTCKAAAKILFPNERRLCDYVFPMSSFAADVCFMKVCEELMICLLSFADTIITTESYLPNLLFNIIPQMSKSLHELDRVLESAYKKDFMWLKADTKMVQKRFDILKKFANVVYRDSDTQATVASGGLHPFTLQVMNYIHSILPPLRGSVQGYRMIPGREGKKSSFSQLLARMIELLESNLEAKSRDYTDPALAYLFMMNNLRHMDRRCIHGAEEPYLIIIGSDNTPQRWNTT